jgi:CHASE1-domain containing sensor protein
LIVAVVVETKELLETVAASLVAGVGMTFVFSIAIWGFARFAEHSRSERPLAAGGAGLVAALALVGIAAGVVFGIVVMTHK